MSRQSYDILDRLFFTGVPIVDAEARERFRRLFVDKGFWTMKSLMPPRHPNCILKPWCNLKFGPKVEEIRKEGLLGAASNPIRNMNPMNGQIDRERGNSF